MRPTSHILQSASRRHSVSFIGLGRMGSEMARNLFSKQRSSNMRFVVCDARADAAHLFAKTFSAKYPGAELRVVSSPAEAVLASETVITMLPSSPQVISVYLEEGGIVGALRTLPREAVLSTLCIDSTTLDVGVARTTAANVHAVGASMVDAPVSGGVAGAAAGTLSFLVGGTSQAFDHARPTLAHMGTKILHCGVSGAGVAAKICNNMILGVQQIAVSEAMLLGQKLGLDPRVLAGVVNNSTGACWSSSKNNPVPSAVPEHSPPCERDYEGGFATGLMLKDMRLATEIADACASPVPMAEAAEELYAEAISHEPALEKKDFSAVYRYLRVAGDLEQRKGQLGQSERA